MTGARQSTGSGNRLESGNGELRAEVFEDHLYRHVHFDFFRLASDNVREHSDALFRLDNCHHVRGARRKQRGSPPMNNDKAGHSDIDACEIYDCFTYTVEVTMAEPWVLQAGRGERLLQEWTHRTRVFMAISTHVSGPVPKARMPCRAARAYDIDAPPTPYRAPSLRRTGPAEGPGPGPLPGPGPAPPPD
jgi:hypothetical protein